MSVRLVENQRQLYHGMNSISILQFYMNESHELKISLNSILRSKRGEEIVASGETNFEISSDSTTYSLVNKSAKAENAGVYNLLASNKLGKVTAKTELIVQSK